MTKARTEMQPVSIVVRAEWDDEASVWVATSTDIEGLAIEAERLEDLREKLAGALTDLLELNGYSGELPEIPVHVLTDQVIKVRTPHAA